MKLALPIWLLVQTSALQAQETTLTQDMFDQTYTQTESWFTTIMGPDAIESYAQYNSELQAMLPKDEFASLSTAETERDGAIRFLEIHNMTPYSTPDIVIAVDFAGVTELDSYVCGYIVWEGVAENQFQIVRVEKNYLNAEIIANMPTVELVKLMAQFHCSPAAIEAATGAKVSPNSTATGGSE